MRDEDIIDIIVKNTFVDYKILEVGSSSGEMAFKIAERTGCTVYGVDSSNFAVVSARGRAMIKGLSDKVIFETKKAEDLNLPTEFFDLVYTVRMLHETKTNEVLMEMYRVLKRSGRIIIVDWVKGAKTGISEQYFSPKELEIMIENVGFRRIRLDILNDIILLIANKR
jgi:ubiquinone/menaquinone biosynthesis C-methylase UbiE